MNLRIKSNGSHTSRETRFEELFSKELFKWTDKKLSTLGTTLPYTNIIETEKEFLIDLAAPGLTKTDFKIELLDNIIAVSVEKPEIMNPKETFIQKEFNYLSFTRSFNLPNSADLSKIQANYLNGILHLKVAKKKRSHAKEGKNISVK